MEKRIGVITIIVKSKNYITDLNDLFTKHSEIILARQGLPLIHRCIHFISLIVEGNTDQIGSLTGKIGRLPDIQVKSILTSYRETDHDNKHDISK